MRIRRGPTFAYFKRQTCRRLGSLIFLIGFVTPSYAETDAVKRWQKEVRDRLIAVQRYPPEARNQAGSVVVSFVIDRSGKLISSWLRESSGVPALDAEALPMLDRAQPFPPPPAETSDDRLKIAVEFIFVQGQSSWEKEQAALNAKMRSICRGC